MKNKLNLNITCKHFDKNMGITGITHVNTVTELNVSLNVDWPFRIFEQTCAVLLYKQTQTSCFQRKCICVYRSVKQETLPFFCFCTINFTMGSQMNPTQSLLQLVPWRTVIPIISQQYSFSHFQAEKNRT